MAKSPTRRNALPSCACGQPVELTPRGQPKADCASCIEGKEREQRRDKSRRSNANRRARVAAMTAKGGG